jgi:hypothetical protein
VVLLLKNHLLVVTLLVSKLLLVLLLKLGMEERTLKLLQASKLSLDLFIFVDLVEYGVFLLLVLQQH